MRNDVYEWIAGYHDGTVVREYEEDGTEHGWADIDQSRLALFRLEPQVDGLQPIVLMVTPSSRPIFYRKRRIVQPLDGSPALRDAQTVIGWQRTVGGQNVTSYVIVLPNGVLVVSDHEPEFE